MEKYISVTELKKQLNKWKIAIIGFRVRRKIVEAIINDCKDSFDIIIDETPAADVQKVTYAHWEDIEDYNFDIHYRCSNCKTEWYLEEGTPQTNDMLYCPHCGAKIKYNQRKVIKHENY